MSLHSTTDTAEKSLESKDQLMNKLWFILSNNALVRVFSRPVEEQYRPEKHYMRGPGPKAKAKADGSDVTLMNGELRKSSAKSIRD